ncbi:MAG: GNAT family N-acetyltransferase [Gammaproteobacteria bacterium]|nr:GNAT family N-acetyltransferase [Gammaproteobacteria bacterium]NIX59908.1 GNAT family N-acetyltransferase [candidate division Zixibacteria bacterium]
MKIRKCTQSDAEAVSRLSDQLGYPVELDEAERYLLEILQDSDHSVIVVEDKNSVIAGWIHVFKTKRVFRNAFAEIVGLVVDEAKQGIGLGRALLEAAEEWAERNGCSAMLIRSNVVRSQAHGFYEQAGYSVLKTQAVFRKGL